MATLAEWERKYMKPERSTLRAQASRLPYQDADGYSFGGAAIVTIGEQSIMVGNGDGSFEFAEELARRWNAAL